MSLAISVASAWASGASKPFVPSSITGLSLWLRADLGVIYVQGPVVATGTSPPAVTFSGTPSSNRNTIVLTCTAAGTNTTAMFSWTLNGVAQTPFTAAATVVLPGTGITATFPAGAYTNTPSADTYTSVVTVSAWADQSGNGNNFTAAGLAQPVYSATGGPNGRPALVGDGVNTIMQLAFTLPQPIERWVSAKYVGAGTTGTIADGFTVNTARMYRNTKVTEWSLYAGINGDGGGYLTNQWNVFTGLYNGSSSGIGTCLNGSHQSANTAPTSILIPPNSAISAKSLNSTTPGGMTMWAAGNGADKAPAYIDEIVMYSAPLTAAQRTLLADYFWSRRQKTNTLLFDGNSFLITESSDLSNDVALSLTSFGSTAINNGVGGETTIVMAANAPTVTDPYVNQMGGSGNVLVAAEITNDVYYGATAASAYSDIVSYCQARRAAGWKVVVCTFLSRSGSLTPGNFNTTRATVNANIQANWATFADAIADWASDPNMGINGAETNLTYFQNDLTHPNVLGCTTLAAYVTAAIQSLGFT